MGKESNQNVDNTPLMERGNGVRIYDFEKLMTFLIYFYPIIEFNSCWGSIILIFFKY